MIIVSILTVIAIGFIYSNYKFRITSITPGETLPISSETITIKVNRLLLDTKDQPDDFVKLEPSLPFSKSTRGDEIIINLKEQPEQNIKLSISLNVKSKENKKLNKTIVLTTKNIPFNNLSKEEKEKQIRESSIEGDSHPLLSILPVDNLSYKISFLIDNTSSSKEIKNSDFVVYINTFATNDGYTNEEYISVTNELRRQAKDWIREESGVDPSSLTIYFTPSDETLGGAKEIHD